MGARAFGRVIAEERRARGLDEQKDFAAKLRELADDAEGYPSDALVGHWERADRTPNMRAFHLLSRFFGWDVVKRAQLEALLMAPDENGNGAPTAEHV
jgi:ribosome-binding protein aMBF1 (putative translation factor)